MNSIQEEMKKYVLIYLHKLNEEEQEKIIRLSSAKTSHFISSQSSPYFYIIELMAECGYDLVGYQSSGMIIETALPLTMLRIDTQSMILEASGEFFEKVEQYNEVLRDHQNLVDNLNKVIYSAGEFSNSYFSVFDEYSEISDEYGWEEVINSINLDREALIEKITESLDGYIVKQ